MDPSAIESLLNEVREGRTDVAAALEKLRHLLQGTTLAPDMIQAVDDDDQSTAFSGEFARALGDRARQVKAGRPIFPDRPQLVA